ncbi:MAG: PrsW family intramembrane metalloprotease [Lentisphaeria bacterium]|nr:PrsW family intramembrane metalloprotease [Lentisphaeria bacterium]
MDQKKYKDLFSINAEVAVHPELAKKEKSEKTNYPWHPVNQEEAEKLNLSVIAEPYNPAGLRQNGETAYGKWLSEKTNAAPFHKVLSVTLLSGIAGGIFSVIGTLLQNNFSVWGILAAVIAAPLVEEIMKQSGMIWMLEKRPWLVKYRWQFILVAFLSAGIFATLENLVYQSYLTTPEIPAERLQRIMAFRWKYCTLLHICCTLISTLSLQRVWQHFRKIGKPCEIQRTWIFFGIAMFIHGLYNLIALLFIKL